MLSNVMQVVPGSTGGGVVQEEDLKSMSAKRVDVSENGAPLCHAAQQGAAASAPRNLMRHNPWQGLQLRRPAALESSLRMSNEGSPAGFAFPFGQLMQPRQEHHQLGHLQQGHTYTVQSGQQLGQQLGQQ
ncbi:hypothetical protein ABBQ38_012457 [Trebouxia sp. C0009 RCD-2024]